MIKQCPEMYLLYKDNFWHCRCVQSNRKDTKCYSIKIRTGKVKGQIIQLLSLDVLPSIIFDDEKQALDYVAIKVQSLLDRGYQETAPKSIRQSVDQLLAHNKHKTDKLKKLQVKVPQFKEQDPKNTKIVRGKLDNGFRILLADTWHEGIDPQGFMLSEKLDGMRVLWRDHKLISKNNTNISIPHYFTEGWPKVCLDGELWLGRGQYQPLVSIAKRETPNFQEWQGVKFMVFDLPEVVQCFKKRLQLLKQLVQQSGNPYLQVVQHTTCKGLSDLQEQLVAIEAKGGEGIMLRNPDSLYEGKRSKGLLKVKSVADDDALVVGYEDRVGERRGSIRALKCQTRKNIYFSLWNGFSYEQKRNPPKVGQVVTYKYFGLTREGQPRFPIFVRLRDEMDV